MAEKQTIQYPPTKRENFRVVVSVDKPWMMNGDIEDTWQRNAGRVYDEVKRHIDGWDDVSVESDIVCIFCGLQWEVQNIHIPDCPKGQPLCCDDAIALFDATQKAGS